MVYSRSPRAIFVWATGQEDNIGDVVLRRIELDELRKVAPLHVYTGPASAEFLRGLSVTEDDVLYADHETWWNALRAERKSGIWFVDKPGEIQLDKSTLKRQLKALPTLATIRQNGGAVLRLGVGLREWNRSIGVPLGLLVRYASKLLWRDNESGQRVKSGSVMPDWAFGDSPTGQRDAGARNLLVVEMRGDRPEPSDSWLAGVREVARISGLQVIVVTQVARDEARGRWLADRLSADLLQWARADDHFSQERKLRNVYSRAALAISDRLHVLIIAAIEGCPPLSVTEWPEQKIQRHFDAIGYPSVSYYEDPASNLPELARISMARGVELQEAVETARRDVRSVIPGLVVPASASSRTRAERAK